jgi:hypothetical protein
VCNKPYKNFDGFRHATFGDTITVERRISAVGSSSSYALKDHTGRWVRLLLGRAAAGAGAGFGAELDVGIAELCQAQLLLCASVVA